MLSDKEDSSYFHREICALHENTETKLSDIKKNFKQKIKVLDIIQSKSHLDNVAY